MRCPDCTKEVEIKTVDGIALFNCSCGAHGGVNENSEQHGSSTAEKTGAEKGTEGPISPQATTEQIAPASEPASAAARADGSSGDATPAAESDNGSPERGFWDTPITDWLK